MPPFRRLQMRQWITPGRSGGCHAIDGFNPGTAAECAPAAASPAAARRKVDARVYMGSR